MIELGIANCDKYLIEIFTSTEGKLKSLVIMYSFLSSINCEFQVFCTLKDYFITFSTCKLQSNPWSSIVKQILPYIPTQLKPLPWKKALHLHIYEPGKLVHVALT